MDFMIILRLLGIILMLGILAESQIQELPITAKSGGLCLCAALDLYNSAYLPLYRNSVTFTLYTRSSSSNGKNIILGDVSSLQNSGFNRLLPLKVITHGWFEQNKVEWMIKMKDAFLTKEDVNVVLTDWSPLAVGTTYGIAAYNAQYVGRIVAEFLQFVQTNSQNFTPKQVHLVGFSMGAHISGIAGRNYPGTDRITGLDPAGPIFECLPSKDERLTPDDADFVDVIHTNDACNDEGAMGIGHRTPLGHQDFYVNGGAVQPGCAPYELDLIVSIASFILLQGAKEICHHVRATEYFVESILSSVPAYGFKCVNYQTFRTGACLSNERAPIGYPANRALRGNFFISTRDQSKFFLRYVRVDITGISMSTPGVLKLIFSDSSGTTLQTILLSDGLLTRTNTGILPLPLAMTINEVITTLRYEPLNIFLSSSFMDAVGVSGVDIISNEKYCVINRATISPTVRKLTLGTC